MQRFPVVLLVLACAGVSFGQLSGPLSGVLGPGTYTVVGNIRVDTSQTLTILPSTTLDFQGPFRFDIYGLLSALGHLRPAHRLHHQHPNRHKPLARSAFLGTGEFQQFACLLHHREGVCHRRLDAGQLRRRDILLPIFAPLRPLPDSEQLRGCQWRRSLLRVVPRYLRHLHDLGRHGSKVPSQQLVGRRRGAVCLR